MGVLPIKSNAKICLKLLYLLLEAFRVEDVLEMDNFDYYDNNEAKELVFRTLGFPLQGECK